MISRLKSRLKFPIWPLVLGHDLVMVVAAWMGSFWLRFNLGDVPDAEFRQAVMMLPLVVAIQCAAFYYTKLYRGFWRFTSITDLLRVVKSVIFGILPTVTLLFLVVRLNHIPRAVFPLYAMMLPVFLGAPRFFFRYLKDRTLSGEKTTRMLIVGAGVAGDLVARDALRGSNQGFFPVGFVDDDERKRGTDLHGIRVLGKTKDIPQIVLDHNVEQILIAIPSATTKEMGRLLEICKLTEAACSTLPTFGEILAQGVTLTDMRAISITDLLGRDQVPLNWDSIHTGITGKVVLITGGGGSIGSQLARQIARLSPERIVIFDHSEFNLYQIERELHRDFPDLILVAKLGSVCDETLVDCLFRDFHPTVVFHAAAYKHVPLLQGQLREAAHNNIVGTKHVAEAADRYGSEIFALISTDKAVNPTSIMGASKRAAEIFCQNFDRRSKTRFITVRFGNVLESAGSVVPLFREQIEKGGPVTVTHPDITRFFMTIPEACQLILEAGALGKGGEIFVLDMGEPMKIVTLAEKMIQLAGKRPHQDIQIVFTGLRPGEKLYEELFYEQEKTISTANRKIFLANYREVEWKFLKRNIEAIITGCATHDEDSLRRHLSVLVPEFRDIERGLDEGGIVIPLPKASE